MRELGNLWKLRHQNIVQLLGYCYEIKHEVMDFCGKLVPAENIYRCLCFEYMNNRSLDKHLYDEGCGHDWQTRYKIIKGTCEGLKYLHEGLESPMYHLDLKPENILLDKNMVPKIADFGISKLIHIDQTQTATQTYLGTRGYQPPEYIENNLISNKYDIFSLGVVMIRIITGYAGYYRKDSMSSQEFIDLVHENWRKKLQATSGCVSLEAECHQVRRCVEIALDCVQDNRKERPTIGFGNLKKVIRSTESAVNTELL
ncbi:cysteine-rich receptor-like protein kinase 14 [Miscanthus floridulus]|uniref:cysteine-rich receptor-like protein kinase 14 n=1 Tax=Miscanthus floridulus TaxID=154761 RepID=UPI0034582BDB